MAWRVEAGGVGQGNAGCGWGVVWHGGAGVAEDVCVMDALVSHLSAWVMVLNGDTHTYGPALHASQWCTG